MGFPKGGKHSEETKAKIALAGSKRKRSEETKKKISLSTKKSWEKQPRFEPKYGEESPNWKGGKRVDDGRLRVWDGDARKMNSRLVVEKTIGRELKTREIVHHIDANGLNDEKQNLFLFRHQSAHGRWHAFLTKHGLEGSPLVSNLEGYVR